METEDLLKMAGVSTTGMAIILIVYRILKTIKGKRFVSSCCGKKLDMSMDVEDITPKMIVRNPVTDIATKSNPPASVTQQTSDV
jgi:hypothetical protein